MGREGVRLSRRVQAWLHGVSAFLFATGAAWLVLHHFVQVQGEFGTEPTALEPWCLKLHGAAAMVFLVLLGTLVRGHIPSGWRSGRNRLSGIGLVTVNVALVVTAWALYYLGGEWVRPIVSAVHWGVGLLLPVGLVWHARRGLASRASQGRLGRTTGSVDREWLRAGEDARAVLPSPSQLRARPRADQRGERATATRNSGSPATD